MEDAALLNFDIELQRHQWLPCSADCRFSNAPETLASLNQLPSVVLGEAIGVDKRKSTLKQMSQSPSALGIVTRIKNIQEWPECLTSALMAICEANLKHAGMLLFVATYSEDTHCATQLSFSFLFFLNVWGICWLNIPQLQYAKQYTKHGILLTRWTENHLRKYGNQM